MIVVAGHELEHERGIIDCARQNANAVEAGRVGDEAVAREASIGRLQAD